MNETMSPGSVILCAADPDGFPTLPQDAVITVQGHDVTVPVWRTKSEGNVGSHPSREYRDQAAGQLCVAVPLGSCTLPDTRPGCLAVAWIPAASRGADNALFDTLMVGPTLAGLTAKAWPVVIDANGQMLVPSLDADVTPEGMLAKSLWPDGWRVLLPTDPQGSMGVAAGPATGPRTIMEGIAQ